MMPRRLRLILIIFMILVAAFIFFYTPKTISAETEVFLNGMAERGYMIREILVNRSSAGAVSLSNAREEVSTPKVIKPVDPCPVSQPPFLLVLVASPAENMQRRTLVRSTWGAITNHVGFNIKVIFYTGNPLNSSQETEIAKESRTYNDIILSEIFDEYRHLALRTFQVFEWVLSACPSARFVMKADDSTFINVKNVVDYIRGLTAEEELSLYQGYGLAKNSVNRNPMSQWYVSEDDYGNASFPPYIGGFAVLLSKHFVNSLCAASKKVTVKDFPVDDAFIGICAEYIGIVPKFLYSPYFFQNSVTFDAAQKKDSCAFLTTMAIGDIDPGLYYFLLDSAEGLRKQKKECT